MRTLAALLALPLLSFSDEQEKPAKSFAPDPTARIVVHEWGVVTCAAGARNQLVGASGPADEDLPAFVTRLTTLGQSYAMVARQPIIYFYTDKPTDFSVQVRFPNGYPTCFDPPAQTWANTADYKTPGAGNIGWQGRLDPAAAPAFPEVAPDHWVAHCRSVDSTPVTIGSRREKYLFYEGAVSIACPVRLELDGDSVRAEFAGTWTAPSMAVRVKDGRAETYPVAGAGRLAPEPVAVESMLAKAGLYEKEANALLAIWRAHFLRRDGLRLITLITGDAYDALLPIAICPKPAETKRVLVLCIDFPTPEIDAKVRALVERLEAEGIDERDRAAAELIALGAIAASSIAKHADHPDPEVRARVAAVLEKLASPVPVPKPAVRPTRVKHR